MTEYVTWIPKYEGHAPTYWKDDMPWSINPLKSPLPAAFSPRWNAALIYFVPFEALSKPFDVDAWLAQGRDNLNKLPNGVVLPESPDWADALVSEWHKWPMPLCDFIRKHCRPIGDLNK